MHDDQFQVSGMQMRRLPRRRETKTHRTASAVNPSPMVLATELHAGFTFVVSRIVNSSFRSFSSVQPPPILLVRNDSLLNDQRGTV